MATTYLTLTNETLRELNEVQLTSSNFSVSKIDKVISFRRSLFTKSPSPTGMTANTLPAETLCKPEILISSINQESSF